MSEPRNRDELATTLTALNAEICPATWKESKAPVPICDCKFGSGGCREMRMVRKLLGNLTPEQYEAAMGRSELPSLR